MAQSKALGLLCVLNRVFVIASQRFDRRVVRVGAGFREVALLGVTDLPCDLQLRQ